MTLATVMANRRGALEYCLALEGIQKTFSTNAAGAWTGLPTGVTTLFGTLRRQELRYSQRVTPATAELQASGMTFRLVDGFDASGNPFAISALLTGLQAATTTRLTATLATGGGPALVESTTGFASSGDIYCELETIGYATKGGAQFDAALTRGKYGSKEVVHTYDATDANDVRADFGLVPEVTDRPVSWYGRRASLYVAEYQANGVLSTAELVWKGRLTGELTAEGMEWIVPAESLWDALNTEILAGQAQSVVKGILLLNNVTVDLEMVNIDGGASNEGTITISAGKYQSAQHFYAHVTEQINAAIIAFAGPTERYEIMADAGIMYARQTAPAGAATYETLLYFPETPDSADGAVVAAALNATMALGAEHFQRRPGLLVTGLALPHFAAADGHFFDMGPAPMAVVALGNHEFDRIPLESATNFSAWYDDQNSYLSASVVTIAGDPYILAAVTPADDTIDVYQFTDRHQHLELRVLVQPETEPPLIVRHGVWLRGTMPTLWRDGFIDNASVPLAMRAGLDSADIDWTDISARVTGGPMDERDRLLTEPVSFRELLQEDFRWSGLVPILSGGKVTARRIGNTGLVRDDGSAWVTVDSDIIRKGDTATLEFGQSRVINRMEFSAVREAGRPGGPDGAPSFDVEVTINERQSQGRYRLINSSKLECTGVATMTEQDISAGAYGIASSVFALAARDYPLARVGCTGVVYSTLPMDCVYLTHWLLPSHMTANARGLTAALCLVLGVDVDLGGYSVDLSLLLLTDGARRSGFAPAAEVASYTDNGAGAGAQQYQLTLTTLVYSATAEGNFFTVGDKVVMRQWDVDAITVATEAFTVTAVAAGSVYIDAAPTAGMQAEIANTVILTLNLYDTASQTSAAKKYLHVADDADNLLGTSSDLGFVMG